MRIIYFLTAKYPHHNLITNEPFKSIKGQETIAWVQHRCEHLKCQEKNLFDREENLVKFRKHTSTNQMKWLF